MREQRFSTLPTPEIAASSSETASRPYLFGSCLNVRQKVLFLYRQPVTDSGDVLYLMSVCPAVAAEAARSNYKDN